MSCRIAAHDETIDDPPSLVDAIQAQARFRLRESVEGPRAKPMKGKRHFHDGRVILPGESVQLNESQATALADKFEEVRDVALPESAP